MKRVLVITDSLGMPRKHKGADVLYNDTWPVLLNKNYNVIHFGVTGATIDFLYEKSKTFTCMYFDYVIVQSGIVDCAPRTLSRREKVLVENIPFLGRLVYPILKKYGKKIRAFRNKKLTTPSKFELTIQKINKLFNNSKVFFIGIIPGNIEYEKQVAGISKSILEYNKILKKESNNYIDLKGLTSAEVLDDHHHLSQAGNIFVYQKIVNELG